MALAEVGSGTQRAQVRGTNVTSTNVAFPANVTAGNLLLVLGAFWNSANTETVSVTDSLGTSYTVVHGGANAWTSGFGKTYIAYGVAPSSGANTVTVTASAAGSYINGVIDEFSGQHATPVDVDGGESFAFNTANPSDGITTLTDNDLVLGVMTHADIFGHPTVTSDPLSGYTLLDEDETGDRCYYAAEFKIAGAAGAETVGFTLGNSGDWRCQSFAFKPAAGGAPAPTRRSLNLLGVS